jgi:hypothetical protein
MGEMPNFDGLPRVRPLSAASGGDAHPGRPPQAGVQDLVFMQSADGSSSIDYCYQDEDYYIHYSPSVRENCYNYSTKTVTNDGDTKEGEFCR